MLHKKKAKNPQTADPNPPFFLVENPRNRSGLLIVNNSFNNNKEELQKYKWVIYAAGSFYMEGHLLDNCHLAQISSSETSVYWHISLKAVRFQFLYLFIPSNSKCIQMKQKKCGIILIKYFKLIKCFLLFLTMNRLSNYQ